MGLFLCLSGDFILAKQAADEQGDDAPPGIPKTNRHIPFLKDRSAHCRGCDPWMAGCRLGESCEAQAPGILPHGEIGAGMF